MIGATLFSGIGAPETAMPHWDWRWHAEIEKFPAAVMAARHGSINLGDVTADGFTARAGWVARPDILVFGSPCQSFSVAGKRLGLDDPRGNLAIVALAIARHLQPRWLVFENVPGLLSSADGRDFGLFLRTMEECGYPGAWRVLDAQHFGVPQRRRRVFFVGYLGDWRPAVAVLFEPESLRWDSAPGREARQEVAGAIGAGSKRSGQRIGRREAAAGHVVAGTLTSTMGRRCGQPNDDNPADYLVAFGGNNTEGAIDVATACDAHGGPNGRLDFESETFVAHSLRADGFDAGEDGTGRGTPLVAMALMGGANGGTGKGARSGHGKDGTLVTAFDLRNGTDGPLAQTLQAAGLGTERGGNPNAVPHVLAQGVRRLTPRECERLQGYGDDYTLVEFRGKPAADGPRYKAIGNSMAVPVMRWILSRIEQFGLSLHGPGAPSFADSKLTAWARANAWRDEAVA